MKRMIDTEKFLDKLLYMGYMDEEKSEVEDVANNMTEDAYTKDDVIVMLEEVKKEIIELPFPQKEPEYMQGYSYCQTNILDYVIQQKINSLKENKDG